MRMENGAEVQSLLLSLCLLWQLCSVPFFFAGKGGGGGASVCQNINTLMK